VWIALSLGAIALAAALLAMPVDLRFLADEAAGSSRMRIEWAFGLIALDMRGHGKRSAEADQRAALGIRKLLRLWNSDVRPRATALLQRLLRTVRFRNLCGRARIGLGDPAETGMALAMLLPLTYALDAVPGVELQVEPDFQGTGVSGDMQGAVRVFPILVIPPVVAFALSPTTLRSLRLLRSNA